MGSSKVLPPELCTEVLVRLPAKTLVRFRCVCKAWCSTIDAPDFLSMHLSLYKNNVDKNRFLVMKYSNGYNTLQVRRRDNFKISTSLLQEKMSGTTTVVLGYCNGLVLLSRKDDYGTIKLWNPSIQKFIVLPRCPGVRQIKAPIIGFVPSSHEYKVAAFSFSVEKLSVSISVYSVSDHLWRDKTAMIDFPLIFVQSMGYRKIYDYYIFDKWKIYYSHK
ncbi:putative F-box protein At3g16210 [Spinacia oleracea]|uniref:F-box protein At3g16210 n=1 Tax=Spinacia oleracea TaxID=3562 RepID=A0ABM3QPL3_SPIOL|nr:putative F-box protein At3g16210 [Spinacia oleracea]